MMCLSSVGGICATVYIHVEVRGQFGGVSSLFPSFHGFQSLNLGFWDYEESIYTCKVISMLKFENFNCYTEI